MNKKTLFSNVASGTITLIIMCSYLLFVAYQNGWPDRSYQDKYVLTDGVKTVVFQGMRHVALTSFYHEVGNEIKDYRKQNYQIVNESFLYEKNDRLEKSHPNYLNEKKYYDKEKVRLLKIVENILKENNYPKYMSQKLIMINYTSYDDKYIDLSQKEFVKILNSKELRKNSNDYEDIKNEYSSGSSSGYSTLYKNEKAFIFLDNTMDSYIHKLAYCLTPIIALFDDDTYFREEIILKKRDIILSNFVLESDEDKIYINYGAAHFEGFFDNLKKSNPNWKIIEHTKKAVLGKIEAI